MKKTLVIVRHGHRNKPFGRAFDNGLSQKGKDQADKIAAFYQKRFGNIKAKLLTSPKKRCVETLEPLSEYLRATMKTDKRLLEAGDTPEKSLAKPIAEFVDEWKESRSELTIACSHGDWIPECLNHLFGLDASQLKLKKGCWIEVSLSENNPKLCWIVQQPE